MGFWEKKSREICNSATRRAAGKEGREWDLAFMEGVTMMRGYLMPIGSEEPLGEDAPLMAPAPFDGTYVYPCLVVPLGWRAPEEKDK